MIDEIIQTVLKYYMYIANSTMRTCMYDFFGDWIFQYHYLQNALIRELAGVDSDKVGFLSDVLQIFIIHWSHVTSAKYGKTFYVLSFYLFERGNMTHRMYICSVDMGLRLNNVNDAKA